MLRPKLQSDDVVIARVVKARGIRGEVACEIETDFPERFDSLDNVTMLMPDGSRKALVVENCWFHKDRVILKFEGLDDRNAAEQMPGACLVIPESDARELEDDRFYEYQIVGAEVVTIDGINVGRVSRLLRTGGTDLLVVVDERGREQLIPFADDICPEVELAAGRITINPPEGLLDVSK